MYTYALVTLFMLRWELCLQGIHILKEKHMFSNLENSLCVMMYQEMTFIHWTSVCTSWFCAISQSSSLSSLLDGGSREFPNAKPLVVDPKVTSGSWGGAWGMLLVWWWLQWQWGYMVGNFLVNPQSLSRALDHFLIPPPIHQSSCCFLHWPKGCSTCFPFPHLFPMVFVWVFLHPMVE